MTMGITPTATPAKSQLQAATRTSIATLRKPIAIRTCPISIIATRMTRYAAPGPAMLGAARLTNVTKPPGGIHGASSRPVLEARVRGDADRRGLPVRLSRRPEDLRRARWGRRCRRHRSHSADLDRRADRAGGRADGRHGLLRRLCRLPV